MLTALTRHLPGKFHASETSTLLW